MSPLRVVAVLAALACGDDRSMPVDAPLDSRPDADPNANLGLGMPCYDQSSCDGSSAPACIAVDGDTTDDGFCSLECGVTEHGGVVPDHTLCQDAYAGTVGVPSCLLAEGDPPTRYYCGILCGPSPTVALDDGPCPAGLACLISIASSDDPGHELCSD
jgi:hypothetical protein